MAHKQVVTTVIMSNVAGKELHRIDDVVHEYPHYGDWLTEKVNAGVSPKNVTKEVIVKDPTDDHKNLGWEAFDEVLPNGDVLRTIFVFDLPRS